MLLVAISCVVGVFLDFVACYIIGIKINFGMLFNCRLVGTWVCVFHPFLFLFSLDDRVDLRTVMPQSFAREGILEGNLAVEVRYRGVYT